jgi:HupE / UreJ protein
MRPVFFWPSVRLLLLTWTLLCGIAPAQAHLMAAQKGTLNIVGDAAFLVASVPVSALQGVDNDGDGALSKAEWANHVHSIREQVTAGVQVLGANGPLPLELMMLDTTPPESTPMAAARHLVVLGRFRLDAPNSPSDTPNTAASEHLTLRFSLFGQTPGERVQDFTITRQKESQWLRLTPEHGTQALLPGAAAVFWEYAGTGATHVLSGADHMLFLLVVLSAGWHWRALLGALTCFTVGHALTLVACIWGGWSVSARIVEPAIAATIVGMAALDGWSRWRAQPIRPGVRLVLVFGCALVHGLGLAGALSELTHWAPGSSQLALALAGFNVGIEAAQMGVAALAGLAVLVLNRLTGAVAQQRVIQFGSVVGMAAGAFWLIERVAQAA